jgi:hypothetical protein
MSKGDPFKGWAAKIKGLGNFLDCRAGFAPNLVPVSAMGSDILVGIRYRHYSGCNALGASGGISAIVLGAIASFFMMFCAFLGSYLGFFIWDTRRGRRSAVGETISIMSHFYGGVFGIVFLVSIDRGVLRRCWFQVFGSSSRSN